MTDFCSNISALRDQPDAGSRNVPGHSHQRRKDTVGVALCPDCGFVGIISRAAEDDCGEFVYRCEECQLALERSAKSFTRSSLRTS
jgi:predicted RNA-binding Zn-ribbon protein involved in translation (DUF1610 family)